MNVLIVEDETAAFESLAYILKEIDPAIGILGNTESVEQTIHWMNKKPLPDLIFMDIHLSDGPAFAIFESVKIEVPIIFTTAYDEYALDAFKVNSIDYLLKPVKKSELTEALHKFNKWSGNDLAVYLSKVNKLSPSSRYRDKFLVPVNDMLLPVDLQEVSYFYTTNKETSIGLKDGRTLPYSKSLDQIFSFLNPSEFYRANKQFVLGRHAVQNITIWFDNRLLVTLDRSTPERIYISKNKAANFKKWLVDGTPF